MYTEGYTAKVKEVLPWGQGISGYGSKISTPYMVSFGSRWYRVYAICYSNVASHYILKGKARLYLRGYELETALGR